LDILHLLIRFLIAVECCTGALAEQNGLPRLIPLGCNFDGGLAWLALGTASAGPELDSFRVEIPDVDLERVDGTISPSSMDKRLAGIGFDAFASTPEELEMFVREDLANCLCRMGRAQLSARSVCRTSR
jgi:hypothetical protein